MKPILLHLFHEPIYSYPLLMGLGWGVGFNISSSLWEKRGLPQKILGLFFILSFIFAWVGAKVFFLLFSMPEKAADYSREVNFWLGGGFVFYGGLVFAGLFAWSFFALKKELKLSDLGLITPGLALGHAIGRLGCFLAGCCFGSQCDLPVGVMYKGITRHPVQLYEAIGLVLIFLLLKKSWFKKQSASFLAGLYLLSYSILRFSLEFFRGDLIRGIYYGLSTSQWVSFALFALGIVILMSTAKKLK